MYATFKKSDDDLKEGTSFISDISSQELDTYLGEPLVALGNDNPYLWGQITDLDFQSCQR